MPRDRLPIWLQVLMSAGVLYGAYFAWTEQDLVRERLGMAVVSAEAAPSDRPRRQSGVPVILAPVGEVRDTVVFEAVGSGKARRSVDLRAEASGKVLESALGSGRAFQSGDVVLRLDDRPQRIALQMAEARLDETKRAVGRFVQLRKSGAVATVAYEEAITAARVAQLDVQQARDAVDDRVVRAPFAGISGIPQVEGGDWIEEGAVLATYDDRTTLLVDFDLPETLLNRVSDGMEATIWAPSLGERTLTGRITDIDTRVDRLSRTVHMRLAVPNPENTLLPGASFTVSLTLPGEVHPSIPELALQFSRGSLHVWRVADDRAEKIEVRLVRRRGAQVLVEGDIRAGERVVIEGTQRLSPGKQVNILDRGAGNGV